MGVSVSVTTMRTGVVAFVATIYPSIQASRLQPVEAIRHD